MIGVIVYVTKHLAFVVRFAGQHVVAVVASFRAHRNHRSELAAIFDRHELGTGNRDHLGTMIFFSSE